MDSLIFSSLREHSILYVMQVSVRLAGSQGLLIISAYDLTQHRPRVVSGIMEHLREELKSSPQFKTNLATLGISD